MARRLLWSVFHFMQRQAGWMSREAEIYGVLLVDQRLARLNPSLTQAKHSVKLNMDAAGHGLFAQTVYWLSNTLPNGVRSQVRLPRHFTRSRLRFPRIPVKVAFRRARRVSLSSEGFSRPLRQRCGSGILPCQSRHRRPHSRYYRQLVFSPEDTTA